MPTSVDSETHANKSGENTPSVDPLAEISNRKPTANSIVKKIVSSEELLLRLSPKLKQLNHAALNLTIPDHKTLPLFHSTLLVDESKASVDSVQSYTIEKTRLFRTQFERINFLVQPKFFFVSGAFVDGSFITKTGFTARARTKNKRWLAIEAEIDLTWKVDEASNWMIHEWKLKDFETNQRPKLMFQDVANRVLAGPTLEKAKTSVHTKIAKDHYFPGINAKLPGNYADDRFFAISTAHHPGVSVVDVDQDGHDDLYVCVRWGTNLLFMNQGDGTFQEAASDFGLDIEGRSSAAIFADFDNDGDPDVMIARSLDRSVYLVNENGTFVDKSSQFVQAPLPFQATSVSVADVNLDGLLDVYFSTYHQDDISQRIDADLSHPEHRIHSYLTKEQSDSLKQRFKDENRSFINQVGPPNLLFINQGSGKFDLSSYNDSIAVWRNSFQASWSDFDQDGDPDLYVANDFAPDVLLRNDREQGFTDVSQSLGITTLGFGMGVSWGDFDGDANFDLYVSNMYSKAGKRITKQVPGLNQQINELALGNHLFAATSDRFELLSLASQTKFPVAKVGWSWGGQFADFNNDRFLDLYVPSGYFTAPDDFATEVDL